MTDHRPAPPYPADTRAKGWRFELDLERIQQSDTWALAAPDERPWLLMLWFVAWQQAPCGSLPQDEELIAARVGMKRRAWDRARGILLRGWVLHSDGRLYHPALTERVLDMLARRCAGSYRRFRAQVLARDGERCAYCGAEGVALHLDHVVPRSRGGPDHPENLTPACGPCNGSKGARTPDEWRAAR